MLIIRILSHSRKKQANAPQIEYVDSEAEGSKYVEKIIDLPGKTLSNFNRNMHVFRVSLIY